LPVWRTTIAVVRIADSYVISTRTLVLRDATAKKTMVVPPARYALRTTTRWVLASNVWFTTIVEDRTAGNFAVRRTHVLLVARATLGKDVPTRLCVPRVIPRWDLAWDA